VLSVILDLLTQNDSEEKNDYICMWNVNTFYKYKPNPIATYLQRNDIKQLMFDWILLTIFLK